MGKRFMALDVGEKNVGVALSDELGILASPYTVLSRYDRIVDKIKDIIEKEDVGELVVGMPYNLVGEIGPQGEKVNAFIEEIRAKIEIPIVLYDERLTSAEAEKLLISADQRREKRRKVIDKVAAAIILQGYLERRRVG